MKALKTIITIIVVGTLLGLLLGTACSSEGPAGVGIESTVDNGNGTFTLNYTDGTSFTTSNLTGPQGAAGGSMAWQGAWAVSTSYSVDDAVENDGSSYICTQKHTSTAGDEPGVSGSWETYWDLFAQVGADGTNGIDGTDGAQGPQGEPGPNTIVAMGIIDSSGAIVQEYNIDSCSWNPVMNRYEIDFTGFSYDVTDYVTTITLVKFNNLRAAVYKSSHGNLYVYINDYNLNSVQGSFSFVVLETP